MLPLVALVSGCGSSGPIPATPLSGTIDGAAWTAKSGTVRKGFGGDNRRSIEISAGEIECGSFSDPPTPTVLTSVDWTAGLAKDFSLSFSDVESSQTATFYLGGGKNVIATDGRIEIIEAPTEKGSKGKIRLRATAESSEIEGEITLSVCD